MMFRLFLSLVLASGLALAQRGSSSNSGINPRTGMPNNNRNDPFGNDRSTRQNNNAAKAKNRFDAISEQLNLDKDQKKQLKGFFDDAAKEAAPIRDQIRQNRQEMFQAMKDGKGEAEINAVAAKQAPLTAQMLAVETKAFTQVVGILKDNQKGKASQVFADRMAGIFQAKKWTDPQ